MKVCQVDGCERAVSSRGWCKMHYTRWLRHGDTETKLRNTRFARPEPKCAFVDSEGRCDEVSRTHGFCYMHAARLKRHGDPSVTKQPGRGEPLVRFMLKVVEADNGCWLWTGAIDPKGYGAFRDEPRTHRAHKWIWEQSNGAVPEGKELDHLCSNRRCVNPKHLEAVTHAENLRRASERSSK